MPAVCRVLAALGVAALVTLGLVWAMMLLIRQPLDVDSGQPGPAIHFHEWVEDDSPAIRPRAVIPPRPRLPPPPRQPQLKVAVEQLFRPPSLDLAPTGVDSILAGYRPATGRLAWGGDLGYGLVPRAMLPPMYPHRALLRGIEGEVVVGFQVDIAGQVSRVWVIRAEPEGLFEASAITAVSRWSFQPPLDDEGQPGPVEARQTITFRMAATE